MSLCKIKIFYLFIHLKVISSEMDLAESRFIREIIILKSEARRFKEKSSSLPACESPLMLRVPPCFSIGYLEPLPTAHTLDWRL
jgi:hypothetical protein